MKPGCPKCKGYPLVQAEGREPAIGDAPTSLVCPHCHGIWLSGADMARGNVELVDDPTDADEAAGREADSRTGMCPYGHRLLIATRIPLSPPIHLNRCPECLGIFFDAGELKRVRAAGLLLDLSKYWDANVQRSIDRRANADAQQHRLVEAFGEDGVAAIDRVAAILAESPHAQVGLAHLFERIGALRMQPGREEREG